MIIEQVLRAMSEVYQNRERWGEGIPLKRSLEHCIKGDLSLLEVRQREYINSYVLSFNRNNIRR